MLIHCLIDRECVFDLSGNRLANAVTFRGFETDTSRSRDRLFGQPARQALDRSNAADLSGRQKGHSQDHRALDVSLPGRIGITGSWLREDLKALRDADRRAVDDTGLTRSGSTALAQVEAVAVGRPTAAFTIDADLLYDARLEQWQYFDTGAKWDALMRASLLYTASYNPVPGLIDRWEHRPGVELRGNRYTLNSDLSMRPGGADLDGIAVQLLRRAVDAQVSLTFAFVRDQNGNAYDRRWGVGITFP